MGEEVPAKMNQKLIEIVLRDFDSLLRKKFGDELIVDSFTTSNLVPPGDNYGSSMLKIDAMIRRDGQKSEPEELSFVAKMTPPTEIQKLIFDSPSSFPKEIYMFEKIIPTYKALERECGIPEEEVFDPLPELYGARLSLNDPTKFDHDAVILMENLKVKNYCCVNRKIGINYAHAKLVIETLARFHALGIAVKLKKPDLFNEFKIRSKSIKFEENMFLDLNKDILKSLAMCPAALPYREKVEDSLLNFSIESWVQAPAEPWGTIVHSDLWVNNVMFCDDENGDSKDVKFVDFQNYLYSNPLRDLIFFVLSSCDRQVCNEHLNDLIDLYYEKLTSHLARLECNVSLFSRESFNQQLAVAGNLEYMHCLMMAKVITAEVDPSVMMTVESMMDMQPTDEFCERLGEITSYFVKANWI